jgi:site-specific DNA-methyltransferase (adenine-specific)
MGTKNVIDVKNIRGNKLHPTEKPIELMKILIANSCNENDTVLDPFVGAGSTLIAAKELNRNAIGIELDKQYYDIAKQRIDDLN